LVARYDATPDAANYVDKNYSPTGKIQFPVITLHTDQDPLVPEFHEAIYADTVGQAGNSDLLVALGAGVMWRWRRQMPR
jgi:hypothetical protein